MGGRPHCQALTLTIGRWRYRSLVQAALKQLWRATPVWPAPGRRFLAVDLETSGLDPACAEVISMAWVPVDADEIFPGGGASYLVKPAESVGDSAVIHQLRDCDLMEAAEWSQVLARFIEAAAGRTLVFHGGQLDLAFLNQGCRRYFGSPLLMPYLDTLLWQQRRLARRGHPMVPGALRLAACRQRFMLPEYPPHNASTDALATAELLLAMQVGHR